MVVMFAGRFVFLKIIEKGPNGNKTVTHMGYKFCCRKRNIHVILLWKGALL